MGSYFFFHGFPGLKSLELLRYLAQRLRFRSVVNCDVVPYPGLHNSNGAFTFKGAVESSIEAVRRRSLTCRLPILVGHSFGGLVALEVAKQLRIPEMKIVLLAPFTSTSSHSQVPNLIESAVRDYPQYFKVEDTQNLIKDLSSLISDANLHASVHEAVKPQNITVVCARYDDSIPRSHLDAFMKQFDESAPAFIEVEDDHGFTRDPKVLLSVLEKVAD